MFQRVKNLKFLHASCGPDPGRGIFSYAIELNPHNSEFLGNGKKGSERYLKMLNLISCRNNWLNDYCVPQTALDAEDEWVTVDIQSSEPETWGILDSSIAFSDPAAFISSIFLTVPSPASWIALPCSRLWGLFLDPAVMYSPDFMPPNPLSCL